MNPDDFCILPESTIRQAIACIDKNMLGIALVTDPDRKLLGTITDGDVRRWILMQRSIDASVNMLLDEKRNTPFSQPITAPADSAPDDLLRLMHHHDIQQIPLIDAQGRVIDLLTMRNLLPPLSLPLEAVIMAGGFGRRLQPLTDELPKPMLPVGDRPLMELIIDQLRQAGVRRVNVATHYLGEKISDYFGDGSGFGVEIAYVTEQEPLGTAGALSLLGTPSQPLLVVNGDILTRLDFNAMLRFHRKHKADLTVGVRQYSIQVPYGVIECNGPLVKSIEEKPHLHFFVNAGIYLLEPITHQFIPRGQQFDMTDLMQCLLAENRTIVSFPIMEYWLDIGQHEDYIRAQRDVENGWPAK